VLGVSLCVSEGSAGEGARPVRIGTKHFTEQWILGEIVAQLLESEGIVVERRFNLQGTLFCFEALKNGELDIYPEYTGTGLVAILKHEVPGDTRLVAEEVRHEFLARWRLAWLAPLGFNNTYTLTTRRDVVERLKVRTISELARHAPSLVLGCGTEFLARPDGYPGLKGRYGLAFKDARALDPGLTYQAVKESAVDVIDAYATDGRVKAFDLVVLRDDRAFFPPYDACLLVRQDLLERVTGVGAILGRLAYKIDDGAMRAMNHEVDAEGRAPAEVAAAFLGRMGVKGKGLASRAGGRLGFVDYLVEHRDEVAALTAQHLRLTGMALLLAMLVGMPAGIVLTRWRRLAGPSLYLVSVVQTVPSLALLGFLIPVTGIGTLPAVLALFVYGLLPIVRNTYTGIAGIDPALLEAGRGMGMARGHILLWVELPLALPVVMAGIRTSGVIAVGTTTLAALIGAGGLGEPIFRGIALVDGPLILSGAVPAALLALLIDWLLGLAQTYLSAPPLRKS
jgi:osmoprotectant transport system permease protein